MKANQAFIQFLWGLQPYEYVLESYSMAGKALIF